MSAAIRKCAILAVTLLIAFLHHTAFAAEDWEVPLPKLPTDAPISLRVGLIETDRFPALQPEEVSRLLSVAQQTVKLHFNLDIVFETPEHLDITDLFAQLDGFLDSRHKQQIADLRNGNIDLDRLTGAIEETLPIHSDGVVAAYSTAADNLDTFGDLPVDRPVEEQRRELARMLSLVLAEKVKIFQTRSGASLFDYPDRAGKPGYNEWIYWDALPSLDLPFEVYLTNQPMVSVEYTYYPLHAVLRGGVTVGNTSGAAQSRYGTASILSVSAFLDQSAAFRDLRGGMTYGRDQAIDLAGKYFAHELGHMLLHLAHPWENPACVMRPAEVLRFDEWAAHLDATRCAIGSSPDMEIGSARIPKPYVKK